MKTIDEEIFSHFPSEQHRALVNLMFTANWLKNWQSELMKPFDITIQQYNILRILKGSHPKKLSMQEIVKRMIDKSPNATRLANKLLKKGLVVRSHGREDRRVIYLEISEIGLDFFDKVNDEFIPALEQLSAKFDNSHAQQVNLFLNVLRS